MNRCKLVHSASSSLIPSPHLLYDHSLQVYMWWHGNYGDQFAPSCLQAKLHQHCVCLWVLSAYTSVLNSSNLLTEAFPQLRSHRKHLLQGAAGPPAGFVWGWCLPPFSRQPLTGPVTSSFSSSTAASSFLSLFFYSKKKKKSVYCFHFGLCDGWQTDTKKRKFSCFGVVFFSCWGCAGCSGGVGGCRDAQPVRASILWVRVT